MKNITRTQQEAFELEFRYSKGYEYLEDHSIEYGITEDENGEKIVISYNYSTSQKRVEGTIEEFRKSLEDLYRVYQDEENEEE